MTRNLVTALLAGGAMAIATPALAQHGGGPGGGGGMGASGHMGGMGSMNASPMGIGNANVNSDLSGTGTFTNPAIGTSQGPSHASANGIANANSHSVLAGTSTTTTVTTGPLTGLATGATLMSNGTAVGTVKQIRMTGNGSVAVVVVQGTNGRLYPIPASKLTYASGTLTTTARLNGINGTATASTSMRH